MTQVLLIFGLFLVGMFCGLAAGEHSHLALEKRAIERGFIDLMGNFYTIEKMEVKND